jgi:hypothetical protein
MGYNDRHFTSPDISPGQSLEHYRNDVAFRQQLASVFQPSGPHNVRMETGHQLCPATGDNWGAGPEALVSHRNDPNWTIRLPLGHDPHQWMPNLMRHLNRREVMNQMREQMNGPYGDE